MTGISLSAPGLVCCAGNSGEALFDAVVRGDQRGIRPITLSGRRFLVGRAVVPGADDTAGRIYSITSAALEQIRPGIEDALAAFGPDRIGVCAGSCDNGSGASLAAHRAFFSGGSFPADYELSFQSASRIAEFIAARFGITGPCLTVATACASGAGAVARGAELINAGLCDAVIAGGADLVSETALLGFAALEAVSDEICNPFSKNRRGITLGEGAAFFVMRKTTEPGIELLGCGESADAYHLTAPLPGGAGAAAAMREALASAGINAAGVGYINLHGTGTPLNDQMEALALQAVFGANPPPLSSTKPVTGHTLGAAGALELAICWMTLDRANGAAALPAHCWDGEKDDQMPDLPFAGDLAGTGPEICMSNSFAFGGCNTSLIIGRKDR
jgi:3-oxoacyl-[acyl-carrier-protein] synthase-1